jgi:hypothetical protein
LTRGGDSLLVNGGFEDARVAPCRLDGIYLDTMESYEANLNYRRDHWAFTRYPLTFDGARRPAIHQIFSHVGFGQDAAEWAWPRDLLVMGNCVPRTPFAAPWLDVIGNEFDWKHGGHWNPWPDRSFLFARVMAGPKPYCALQYGDLTPEEQAKYLERCLFYAVLPTNQAAPDGSWYWRHAPAVERHRPVFATYLPHIVAVADAGWRPRTLARADTPDLWLERYGAGAKQYLAVFNPNGEPVAGVITLEEAFAGPAPRVNARLGPDIEVQGARRFRIELGPENTALLEVIRQRPAG